MVDKSDERLYLVRDGEILTLDENVLYWDISLGTVPTGHKLEEGDKKTPEGLYLYTDYNALSSYHGSLLIHYPNPIDANAAVEDGRITTSVLKKRYKAPTESAATTDVDEHGRIYWCMVHTKKERISFLATFVISIPMDVLE